MELQNLNAVAECNFAVAEKTGVLEDVHIVEETAAASIEAWTLEKIDLVCEHESCTTVKLLNIHLAAVHEQVSNQAALQYEICDAQGSSSPCEARWKSVREHAKAIERHLGQVAQQIIVDQAKLVLKRPCSRAFGGCIAQHSGCRCRPGLACRRYAWDP